MPPLPRPASADADVVVVGLGPAGRALAHRCALLGLTVAAVDPNPNRMWTPTYAAWEDELPEWLDENAVAVRVRAPSAWTTRLHRVDRTYCVLDTSRLQSLLPLDRTRVVAGTAVALTSSDVRLADGSTLAARRVIDARGVQSSPALAQQSAYGIVVDASTAAGALDGQDAWFMDWRRDNGADPSAIPSFLYAVPLGAERFLLEETCLVGRPPLAGPELALRLRMRLAARGIELSPDAPIEKVRFAVEPGARHIARHGPTPFGARAGLMHSGTGYSVAASLACADPLAHELAQHRGRSPERTLWPPSARGVAGLRAVGLRTLLELDAKLMPGFFEHFFDLPVDAQRAYLSQRTNLTGTMTAMRRLFAAAPGDLRRAILGSTFRSLGR